MSAKKKVPEMDPSTTSPEQTAVTMASQTAEAPKEPAASSGTTKEKAAKKAGKKAVSSSKEKAAKGKASKEKPDTLTPSVFVEYLGRQVRVEDMVTAVRHDWGASGQKTSALESLELYIKPEDSAVYYVANGSVHGKVTF